MFSEGQKLIQSVSAVIVSQQQYSESLKSLNLLRCFSQEKDSHVFPLEFQKRSEQCLKVHSDLSAFIFWHLQTPLMTLCNVFMRTIVCMFICLQTDSVMSIRGQSNQSSYCHSNVIHGVHLQAWCSTIMSVSWTNTIGHGQIQRLMHMPLFTLCLGARPG